MSERLFTEPQRFDFFQAVRLLELMMLERAERGDGERRQTVGLDFSPEQEVVRFRSQTGLSFPASELSQIRWLFDDREAGEPPEMLVTFLGLTGPSGVLPQHYTEMMIRRVRYKDYALRDFFDLFNHRLVSLFFRAWLKYRMPFNAEQAQNDPDGKIDHCTELLYCLVGLGTGRLRGMLEVPDQAFLYYAGHFAHFPRTAGGLEQVLCDYFQLPVAVQTFQGQWLRLEPDEQSRLPLLGEENGQHTELGVSCVVGDQVWDVQSKFRLRVGPLPYERFRRLLPTGAGLRPLAQLTRFYAGAELEFDVQLVLCGADVPWCHLGVDGIDRPLLGWNTWLRGDVVSADVDDTVFAVSGV